MTKNIRVRAILLRGGKDILLIKRVRPSVDPYWVTPGGGVEPEDATIEHALHRELWEELGATAEIEKLIFRIDENPGEVNSTEQLFFLCNLLQYNEHLRSGPEFKDVSRGEYQLDFVPADPLHLEAVNLKPTPLKQFLIQQNSRFSHLPDLRSEDGL